MKQRPKPLTRRLSGVKRLPSSALKRPLVVAAVHSLAGLRLAAKLKPGGVDILELRLDALEPELAAVRRMLPLLRLPVLITARHPAEGGLGRLSARRRRELFVEFLPRASLLDVELRSIRSMRGVIASARARGVIVVVSDHHFRATPALARMRARQRRAFAAGADVFKLAAAAGDARSMSRLLGFAACHSPGPRAIMGMGKFGQVSRLVLARAGSVLNYGYLDRPNAPGQWEARELRTLLDRIGG